VPCALSAAGLPIGLQILGPALGETRLLQSAHLFEQVSGVANARPELA